MLSVIKSTLNTILDFGCLGELDVVVEYYYEPTPSDGNYHEGLLEIISIWVPEIGKKFKAMEISRRAREEIEDKILGE